MPGRDRNNLIDIIGKIIILLSLAAIVAHAIARSLSRKKMIQKSNINLQ
jgi:hypothetical protein